MLQVCGSMPYDDTNIKKMIKYQTERKVSFSRHKQLSQEVKDVIHMMLEAVIAHRATIPKIFESPWMKKYVQKMIEKQRNAAAAERTATGVASTATEGARHTNKEGRAHPTTTGAGHTAATGAGHTAATGAGHTAAIGAGHTHTTTTGAAHTPTSGARHPTTTGAEPDTAKTMPLPPIPPFNRTDIKQAKHKPVSPPQPTAQPIEYTPVERFKPLEEGVGVAKNIPSPEIYVDTEDLSRPPTSCGTETRPHKPPDVTSVTPTDTDPRAVQHKPRTLGALRNLPTLSRNHTTHAKPANPEGNDTPPSP